MLDGLDGYQFEELIAKIMKKKGFEKIRVTSKSHDVGKDIIMEDSKGNIILVECKHQNFVGRPVIQKLQGAMNHEEDRHSNKEVKGIIVTSGKFSKESQTYNKQIRQEIELIDGRKLNRLCKELNLIILNGKVQILTNDSFRNISAKDAIDLANKGFSKIYWGRMHNPKIKTNLEFNPACYIKYNVNFNTYTSVGCIDEYSDSGIIITDGLSGEELDEDTTEFFFSGRIDTEKIKEKDENKKISFEFTENDTEEQAIDFIIKEHSHNVNYMGDNNVTYTKNCIPKRRDIDIKQFVPVYLPVWTNEIDIMKMHYTQEFYVKGSKQLYLNDELRKCKICEREKDEYEDMSICPECGRIVCPSHVKIDYLDKETPICTIHAKSFNLWIQNKYFAKKENLKEYKKQWESMNFFQKLFEDKIAFGLCIGGAFIILLILISLFS